MNYKDLQEKSVPELTSLLKEKRELVRRSRFEVAGSKTRNVKESKMAKKDIARILTELSCRATQSVAHSAKT